MTERKIVWESFHIDRFKSGEKERLLKDLDEEDEDESLIAEEIRNAPTLVETPAGIFNIDDSMNPFNSMECRLAVCNFEITEKELLVTNFHEGIEAVQPVSRYKMLIGFAKLFDIPEVRKSLTHKLINIHEYPRELLFKHRNTLNNAME